MGGRTTQIVAAVAFLWLACLARDRTADAQGMGINYGTLSNEILRPPEAVGLIKDLGFDRAKIFSADSSIIRAFANSGVKLSVMVANQQIPEIASSQSSADAWVKKNVAAYYPKTAIDSVLVGNEILSDSSIRESTWPKLVPAMEKIQSALEKFELAGSIKVSTPLASDALGNSYPPSAGSFKSDIAESIIQPLLEFLSRTNSFYCGNVYPYFAWAGNPGEIPLDYALFGSQQEVVRDGSLSYTNLFDAMVDATISAIEKLGFGSLDFAVCETGWPSKGDGSQPGATVSNAARYNNRLIAKTLRAQGTPKKRGYFPTYIFALFNENLKNGAVTERNFGVTYPNGELVYALDIAGGERDTHDDTGSSGGGNGTESPPGGENGGDGNGSTGRKEWCVANSDASQAPLQAALDYACSSGGDCTAIQPNQPCFFPETMVSRASYAFSSYYSKMKSSGGTCDFNQAAHVTQTDPSYGSCVYPSPA
ncbi:glucan endo-1,3-beta-glucosidase 12 [Selaginella moellendorffii]|nr:glucan endo-1,3-beta-glucosidase 12 [Selaginella moellendorffii]|eukprot:XP_002965673.2 glucan endo-1,3-beta-glucosidase 12 [Selaginella moellendorffii]